MWISKNQDDYSGGLEMPDRSFSYENSRFGFNTQEKVDEISGTGNHNTALFWEYDTRLCRRWNNDPKPNISISTYACFGNNPIWFNDVQGDTTYRFNSDGIFIGMGDLDVTGIKGSIGEYKTYKDANGDEFQGWEASKYFSFNDSKTDRGQLNSLTLG